MNLGQFTEPAMLLPRLQSKSRGSAILELSQCLESARRIESASALAHPVLDHESLATALLDDVAIPLACGPGVNDLSFAVGLSRPGIRWGATETSHVHVVFLFAVPPWEDQLHSSLLFTVSCFLADEMACDALRRCTRPEEMQAVFDYVRCVRAGPEAMMFQR